MSAKIVQDPTLRPVGTVIRTPKRRIPKRVRLVDAHPMDPRLAAGRPWRDLRNAGAL